MTSPIEWRPSPNHDERQASVDILLLHYTGMPDHNQALAWLCNPGSKVSAHYYVHEDGRVLALVAEARRAWHAGQSYWCGQSDINSRSIGIEIANAGHPGGLPPFPSAQIEAVIRLARQILGRHPIPPHRVLGHSDVAPGRKIDPGERFPWAELAAVGIGHFVEPASPGISDSGVRRDAKGAAVETLQGLLALYGYGIEVTGLFDQRTENVVAAFQRHFRPARVDGIADASTVNTLQRLLQALP
jgi:N-acetylmuramoyl-L-alanine amidase